MTLSLQKSVGERFRFTERAEPFALGDAEPLVYGYAWRAANPTAALVLVHGLQSHAEWFADAAEMLVDRDISVYALDRRGSGSSPAARGHIGAYTDWFDDIARGVDFAQREYPGVGVHLVGHCFGANLALGTVLTGRTRVSSVVMLTPGFFVLPDYSAVEKIRILLASAASPTKKFRVPQDDGLFSRDPEVVAWIAADKQGARAVTARCLLQVNAMLGKLRREASRLEVPLLVFEAANDRLSDNRRNRELLARALGERCQWKSFDAEHFLLAEPCRDQVLDELVKWVGTHP